MTDYKAETMIQDAGNPVLSGPFLRRKGTDQVFNWSEILSTQRDFESISEDEMRVSLKRAQDAARARAAKAAKPEPTFDNAREALNYFKDKSDANTEAVRALNTARELPMAKNDPAPSILQTVTDTTEKEKEEYKEKVNEHLMFAKAGDPAPWDPQVSQDVKNIIYGMTMPLLSKYARSKGLHVLETYTVDVLRAKVLNKLEYESKAAQFSDKADQAKQIQDALVVMESQV